MRIVSLETLYSPTGPTPALSFLRVHTDEGVVGLGETYYTPATVSAYVHEVLAPQLLGRDALSATALWDDLYAQGARRGAGGSDLRALSALDLALWDLKGKALGVPVHTLLGGATGSGGVRVYNTCAGSTYSSGVTVGRGTWDSQDDLWMARNQPGELAVQLVEQGFVGMKLWPFDPYADEDRGARISPEGLRAGVGVIEQIRAAVGDRIEVMLEGHGLWQIPAASRILNAVADLDVTWAEDMVLAHDPSALARLSRTTPVPLAASEYLMGRWEYRQVLEAQSVAYLHLDPSWCGGISESQRILALASAFGVTSSMHDCTGPMNLLAGLHLSAAHDSVGYQEVLRAFLADVYPAMVDTEWDWADSRLEPPARPGLGAELTGEFLGRSDLVRQVSELR